MSINLKRMEQQRELESMPPTVYGQWLLAHRRFPVNDETGIVYIPHETAQRINTYSIPYLRNYRVERRETFSLLRGPRTYREIIRIVAGWGGYMGYSENLNVLVVARLV